MRLNARTRAMKQGWKKAVQVMRKKGDKAVVSRRYKWRRNPFLCQVCGTLLDAATGECFMCERERR